MRENCIKAENVNAETYFYMQNKFVVEIQSHDIVSLIDPTIFWWSLFVLLVVVNLFSVWNILNAILAIQIYWIHLYIFNHIKFCNNAPVCNHTQVYINYLFDAIRIMFLCIWLLICKLHVRKVNVQMIMILIQNYILCCKMTIW